MYLILWTQMLNATAIELVKGDLINGTLNSTTFIITIMLLQVHCVVAALVVLGSLLSLIAASVAVMCTVFFLLSW